MRELWKAVKVIDGEYYTLGMGPAETIHLPIGSWIYGGEHGISAGNTKSVAKGVLYQIRRRKVLPIPENLEVIRILGDVRYEKSWGAVICNKIYIETKEIRRTKDFADEFQKDWDEVAIPNTPI